MESAIRLRPMCNDDVPGVMAIEQLAFETGWPSTAFERELAHNAMARYIVLETARGLLGFAGLWLMVDEAHVVTVAVLPAERRAGFGRLLV
ncbi:MAG: GNAT family N-acetyltransferase, partial [Dehalococcoidia bacterium]|nr:GNAT family N-acetyltransferase [Dehalococcoidia bacterium]